MSEAKRRICCVIHSLRAGGMERVMSELIGYFSGGENLEVHLILYGIKRDMFYTIPDSVIIHKPTFEFNSDYRTFYTLKTVLFLREKIKQIDPDTILSFGEQWNNMVLLSTTGLKYPVYVSDRCQPDKSIGRMNDFLRKRLYPGACGIIAQTSKAKEIYLQQYRHSNIVVIGNPIRSLNGFTDQTEKENIVLTVGRLIKTKHHDELIKLFAAINKPGWKLVIVGGDALKQNHKSRLQNLIQELGVEECVQLEGYQLDVDSYYQRSKIFAFTSSSEGFPNVIGEAMSAGLPVVSFDCVAGPSDMIEDKQNGFLVPLFDYKNFTDRLEELIRNEDLRREMGDQAKVKSKIYAVDKIGREYLKFILS